MCVCCIPGTDTRNIPWWEKIIRNLLQRPHAHTPTLAHKFTQTCGYATQKYTHYTQISTLPHTDQFPQCTLCCMCESGNRDTLASQLCTQYPISTSEGPKGSEGEWEREKEWEEERRREKKWVVNEEINGEWDILWVSKCLRCDEVHWDCVWRIE